MSKLRFTTQNVITFLLSVVIGILLCVKKMSVLNTLMLVIGILIVAYGIYDIVKHKTVPGIVEAVIGVVIVVFSWIFITSYAIVAFGILLALKGVLKLIDLVKPNDKRPTAIILQFIIVVIGIFLCIAPFTVGDFICTVVGVVLIANGVLALFGKKLI